MESKTCSKEKCKHYNSKGELIIPDNILPHEITDYIYAMMLLHGFETTHVKLKVDVDNWVDVVGSTGDAS